MRVLTAGTFLYIHNPATLAFLTAWRVVSISGHSMLYVKDNLQAPMWVLHVMGWTRVVLCVGIFQPLLLAVVRDTWHTPPPSGYLPTAPTMQSASRARCLPL